METMHAQKQFQNKTRSNSVHSTKTMLHEKANKSS
jgi:hypothetical protein